MKIFLNKSRLAGLVLVLISGFLYGCAAGTWAYTRHSQTLMDNYRSNALSGDLNYYYCGRDSMPYAVVGIDPAYTFESRFWFKIESEEDLYKKIYNLSDLEAHQTMMYAKDIVAPSGTVIGTWFSYYNTTAVTVDEANRTVNVFNPYKPATRFRAAW